MPKRNAIALWTVICLAPGCGSRPPSPPARAGGASPTAPLPTFLARGCARTRTGPAPAPEPGVRQGSTVALARQGQEVFAYVADRDRDRVVVVDVVAKTPRGATPLFGAPEQLQVLDDGRLVVAIGDPGGHIEVFEPTGDPGSPLERLCAREVPAGAFGLATSPDGGTLAVTSAWEPALTAFDASLAPRGVAPLPRAPRGVLIDERNRAFVTHLSGAVLSVLDVDRPELAAHPVRLEVLAGSPVGEAPALAVRRGGSQAYAIATIRVPRPPAAKREPPPPPSPTPPPERVVVPMVSVDPGDAHRPSQFYYGPPPVAGVPKQAPIAVVVDPDALTSMTTHVVATTGRERAGECKLPRAVAARRDDALLYVACEGIDELLELDGRAADPMRAVRRRFAVPTGPTGVAIAATEKLAVVFSQLAGELALVPLAEGSSAGTVSLGGGPTTLGGAALRGRRIFYRSDDPRITADGMACSSCHPDGAEDGLTWFTPDGPRQTPMLAGRVAGTQPFGWTRDSKSVEEYVAETCRRLGGTGLDDQDLSDLGTYLRELRAPPARDVDASLVARGKALFYRRGCVSCHRGGTGTDAQRHELGFERQAIDTPSLLRVGATAPYFHDGRYATLDELLADSMNPMAGIDSLSPPERDAVRAYLESL